MSHILTVLRQQQNLSLEKLADMISVSRQHLAKVEQGQAELKLSQARKCAEIFDISIDDISAGKLPEENQSLPIAPKQKPVPREAGRDPKPQITVRPENVQKFKEVLLYLLEKVGARPNVGKTVLFKLLYFIDFDFYEKYEEQLIGATYRKEAYGPLPVEFSAIVQQMKHDGELQEVRGIHFGKDQVKFFPLRKANLALLKGHEMEMIHDVIRRHGDKNAVEVSEHSHRDIPWKAAKMHEDLEYEAVFYRDNEFSVSDDYEL